MTNQRYGPSTITIASNDDGPRYDSLDEAYDSLTPEEREDVDRSLYRIAAVLFGPQREQDSTANAKDAA